MRRLLACWLVWGCTEDAQPALDTDAAVDATPPPADAAPPPADAAPATDAAPPPEPDAAPEAIACAGDDELSPNQRPASAAPIAVGFSRGDLFMCPGVTDHFALPLAAGQRVRIELVTHPATTDLDLAVDDPTGTEVAASTGQAGEETVRLVAAAEGTYTVRVISYRDQSAGYGLTVRAGCRLDADCGAGQVCDTLTELCAPFTRGACGGDEVRDRHEDAEVLPRGAVEGELCPSDRDWFYLDMQAGESLEVSVSFTAGRNLDLLALGPDGRLVDAAIADANPERLVLRAVPAGRYLIGLVMPGAGDDAVVAYRLTAVSSQTPCRIDRDCTSLGLPICSGDGTCRPPPADGGAKLGGPCSRGSDCPAAAEFCFQGDAGGHDNACTVTCEAAADCEALGGDLVCARRFGGMMCLRACASDDDCSLTRRCEQGVCNRRGRCASDRDCGPGEACIDSDFGPACTLVEE